MIIQGEQEVIDNIEYHIDQSMIELYTMFLDYNAGKINSDELQSKITKVLKNTMSFTVWNCNTFIDILETTNSILH